MQHRGLTACGGIQIISNAAKSSNCDRQHCQVFRLYAAIFAGFSLQSDIVLVVMNLPLGRNSLIKALAALAIGALAAFGFSQNLVVNGSFESEPASVVTNKVSDLGQGQPAPDGWTFTPTDLVASS